MHGAFDFGETLFAPLKHLHVQPVVAHGAGIVFGRYDVDPYDQFAALCRKERRHQVAKQGHLIFQYPSDIALKAHGKSIVIQHEFTVDVFNVFGVFGHFPFNASAHELRVQAIEHHWKTVAVFLA
jgi:hypothetical protein